jgi:hypothetical protein
MKIMYDSLDPWVSMEKYTTIKRAYQIFSRLAVKNKVTILEPNPLVYGLKISRYEKFKLLTKRLFIAKTKQEDIEVIKKPEFPRSISKKVWLYYQKLCIPKIINNYHPDIYVFNDPLTQIGVLDKLNPSIKIVYDMKDDMPELCAPELKELMIKAEKEVFKKVDLVICMAKCRIKYVKKFTDKVVWISEGVEKENIGKYFEPYKKFDKPVIGYTGSINHKKFDCNLVINTAKIMPDYFFLFVGDYFKQKILPKNIIQVNKIPRSKLFNYIASMDLCIIPYTKIPLSHHCCPLKLFDYAALNKPVISTKLKEVQTIAKDNVYFADTPKEMKEKIIEALNKGSKKINEWVKDYNWDSLTEKYEQALKNIIK